MRKLRQKGKHCALGHLGSDVSNGVLTQAVGPSSVHFNSTLDCLSSNKNQSSSVDERAALVPVDGNLFAEGVRENGR